MLNLLAASLAKLLIKLHWAIGYDTQFSKSSMRNITVGKAYVHLKSNIFLGQISKCKYLDLFFDTGTTC